MDKIRADEVLPAVLAQVCLWAFFQKFVYGYVLRDVETWWAFGLATDYFIAFPCLVLACALALSAVLARAGRFVRAPALVAGAGAVALLACPAVVFEWPRALGGPAGTALLAVCSTALGLALVVVLFAWLGRLERQARKTGARGVLLCSLVAYLVYCVVAPSYSNYTPYVLVLEIASLPVAAGAYAFAERRRPSVAAAGAARPASGGRGGGWALVGAALLFAVFLGASYVDFLSPDLPVEHQEQPTFYALLIFGVTLLVAALAADASAGHLLTRRTMAALGGGLAFFGISFMVVFYYAGASGRFCFDFTCALRRLVIVSGFAVALGVALERGMRADVAVTVGFLVPFLGVRVVMRSLGLQVRAGVLAGSADERLTCMLVLGCVGVAGLATVAIAASRGFRDGFGLSGGAGSLGLACGADGRAMGAGDACHERAVAELARRCGLSGRERQMLHYLSLGYSVSRMAEILGISENTVGTHVRSVYKKTGLHTKQEVIDAVAALEPGLASQAPQA